MSVEALVCESVLTGTQHAHKRMLYLMGRDLLAQSQGLNESAQMAESPHGCHD